MSIRLARAEGTTRIGVKGNYPPFRHVAADGTLESFDIANALCAKMAVTCEMVRQEWNRLIPALNARKFDMIVASMSISDKRKKVVDFLDPNSDGPRRFIAAEGALAGHTPEDLTGKTLIVLRNSLRADDFAATCPEKPTLLVDKETAVCLERAAGRGDKAFGSSVVSGEDLSDRRDRWRRRHRHPQERGRPEGPRQHRAGRVLGRHAL